MKNLWSVTKDVLLTLFIGLQLLAIIGEPDFRVKIVRIFVVGGICLYLVIRWKKKRKPAPEDQPSEK
jgi:hypothetical protein